MRWRLLIRGFAYYDRRDFRARHRDMNQAIKLSPSFSTADDRPAARPASTAPTGHDRTIAAAIADQEQAGLCVHFRGRGSQRYEKTGARRPYHSGKASQADTQQSVNAYAYSQILPAVVVAPKRLSKRLERRQRRFQPRAEVAPGAGPGKPRRATRTIA